MSYLAHVDESACAAHGDCEAIAPAVAIRITDWRTGEQVFP